jgi:hypothetical protein
MENLNEIVREEVLWYTGDGTNPVLLPVVDEQHQIYCAIAINYSNTVRRHKAGVVVMARVVEDKVIIEVDNTDKPLDAALEGRGVPREKIILAYEAELTPEAE